MRIKKTSRSGFTLIELLTVIAIIGILAAILFPTIGTVLDIARKAASSKQMQSIATGYLTYANASGKSRVLTPSKLTSASGVESGDSIHGVAEFLAKKVDLTDAGIWIINSDDEVKDYDDTLPKLIGSKNNNNEFQIADNWSSSVPLGYDFALRVGGNDQGTTTPLLWTRGLQASGTWGQDTPWGGGGHIAFFDGHVEYFDEISEDEGQLVDPDNGELTNDITQIHDPADIKRAEN